LNCRKKSVAQAKENLLSKQVQMSQRLEWLSFDRDGLQTTKDIREQHQAGLPNGNVNVRSLHLRLRCRRMRLLHEISNVYPIENCGGQPSILGLHVPSMDVLTRLGTHHSEYVNVSTALGFLAHLLRTIESVLDLRLCINLSSNGHSRTHISLPGSPREWPLFLTGDADSKQFNIGLQFMEMGLRYLVRSHGPPSEELDIRDGNLLKWIEMFFKREFG